MAKRNLEDGAIANGVHSQDNVEPAAKKLKKEKKRQESTAEQSSIAEESKEEKKKRKAAKRAAKELADAGVQQTNGDGDADEKAAKAARKALKRAQKEAKSADSIPAEQSTTGNADGSTTEEGKKSKKSSREGKTTADGAQSNGHTDKVSKPAAATGTRSDQTSVGYTEDPALSALPQSEIDKFIADQFIAVSNPDAASPTYRPITSFKYVPVADKSPFGDYKTPTPIQAAAWPYLFAGRDVVGVAETGSGKTMAFGVPCIRYITSLSPKEQKNGIRACIVSPTRELALQIHEQLVKLATPAGLKVACVYGGVNKDMQRETLRGASTIVATPGRLADFISEGSIDLGNVGYLVLDEADRMLDKGFEEEMRRIIGTTPSQGRQTLMFTATWPPLVRELASTFMNSPVRVNIGDNPTGELRANTRIVQEVEVMDPHDKNDRLLSLLKQYQSGKNKSDRILVFCLYKKEATRIEGFIRSRGFEVAGIHGDLSQQQRTASLEAFKQGKVPLLVATDVAARGLDIPAVKVVINVSSAPRAEGNLC